MSLATRTHRTQFPYFPLYVDEWLSSAAVDGFTLEQQAAYLRLLLRQWKAVDGRLPKDETTLARWSGLGARWRTVGRPILARCFVESRGGWVNPKCYDLWVWARDKSAKAQAAAAIRHGRA
jgi:uncharacterized protein YdaU (DUF1376 family)